MSGTSEESMGKLRTALRVVTGVGIVLIGLGVCLTGYAVYLLQ